MNETVNYMLREIKVLCNYNTTLFNELKRAQRLNRRLTLVLVGIGLYTISKHVRIVREDIPDEETSHEEE